MSAAGSAELAEAEHREGYSISLGATLCPRSTISAAHGMFINTGWEWGVEFIHLPEEARRAIAGISQLAHAPQFDPA